MTWTPVTPQPETWTAITQETRVFDPHVFDRAPIFDTGPTSGVWDPKTEQAEVWVNA